MIEISSRLPLAVMARLPLALPRRRPPWTTGYRGRATPIAVD
jgi:hypothetical protein